MLRVSIRIIAALEIVGGVVGVCFVAWWLLAAPFNLINVLLAPIPVGIYVFSLVAGVSLWRGGPFGRKASIVVQAIQLPKIVTPWLIFMFSFGFDLWVHYLLAADYSTLGFECRFLAFNQLFVNVHDAPVGLGVSISALISLFILNSYEPGMASDSYLAPPPPTYLSDEPDAAPNIEVRPTPLHDASQDS